MITGLISYKEKNCVFKLNNFTLEIEEIENRDNLYIDDLEFLFNQAETMENSTPNLLKARGFNGKIIHFNVVNINQTGTKTHSATLYSYIVFEHEETKFDGIQINSNELNWFHNVKQSYTFTVTPDTGQSEVKVKPFNKTDKQFEFSFEGQDIQGNFNISRNFSNVSTMPIKLQTDMNLYFEPTDKFEMVEKLFNVTYSFMKFITYRRNVSFGNITLKKKNDKTGKYRKVGNLYIKINKSEYVEEEKVIQERIIDLPLIEENLGELFEKLAETKIYISHIPDNSFDNNRITPSRIIMATAGFEWQFQSTYESLSRESDDKYKQQKEEILAFLNEKVYQNTGKNKKYFKRYRSLLLRSDLTLSDKINWALTEFSDELKLFITSLYKMNGVNEVKYSDISERVQNQRNDIAHGNIDKEFNSYVILDLLVLEWLYYAMVLSDIGVSRQKVKLAINKLFNRRFAL